MILTCIMFTELVFFFDFKKKNNETCLLPDSKPSSLRGLYIIYSIHNFKDGEAWSYLLL